MVSRTEGRKCSDAGQSMAGRSEQGVRREGGTTAETGCSVLGQVGSPVPFLAAAGTLWFLSAANRPQRTGEVGLGPAQPPDSLRGGRVGSFPGAQRPRLPSGPSARPTLALPLLSPTALPQPEGMRPLWARAPGAELATALLEDTSGQSLLMAQPVSPSAGSSQELCST